MNGFPCKMRFPFSVCIIICFDLLLGKMTHISNMYHRGYFNSSCVKIPPTCLLIFEHFLCFMFHKCNEISYKISITKQYIEDI